MIIDKELALKMWDEIYGADHKWAVDPFGIAIYRDDYGEADKVRTYPGAGDKLFNCGWELNHLRPANDYKNEEAADFKNNLEPMNIINSKEKGNQYPHFDLAGKAYRVVECTMCNTHDQNGYGIIDLESGERIDWKGKTKLYYITRKKEK